MRMVPPPPFTKSMSISAPPKIDAPAPMLPPGARISAVIPEPPVFKPKVKKVYTTEEIMAALQGHIKKKMAPPPPFSKAMTATPPPPTNAVAPPVPLPINKAPLPPMTAGAPPIPPPIHPRQQTPLAPPHLHAVSALPAAEAFDV